MPNFPSPPDAGATPALALVVPATDSPPTLARCLPAIEAASGVRDQLLVVRDPPGAGPALARNLGAGRASRPVLVFVDSDVAVHSDALERIRAAFAGDPELDAVFGRYDYEPAAPGSVSRFRNLLHAHVHASSAGPASTFWAGLGAVRADRFDEVGGFDEALFGGPAIEDVELGARLAGAGARVLCDPEIQGTHLKRWSLASMARTDALARARPWARLALAGRAPSDALNLAPRRRLGAGLALAATALALGRRPGSALAALGAMVAAEASLFALLRERGGPALALAGVPLLVLHHLAAAAGAVLGAIDHERAPVASEEAP